MKKLVLLRHGESTWNKENRFTGWTDVDLSEKGLTVHGDKLWDIFQVANKGIKRFPPDITRDEWNTAMLYEIQVGVTWGMFYTKNHGGKYWETRWEQYKKRK